MSATLATQDRPARKDELRARMHARRARSGIDAAARERMRKSAQACARLEALPEFTRARCVLLFLPMRGEIDTEPLVARALAAKRVLLPYVEGETLRAARIAGIGDTVIGPYGTREPARKEPVATDEIDLVVVPGLAFDRARNRLGHGKGHYDRFLPRLRATRIGLAFADQIVDRIAHEAHDVPMDLVVTEEGVIA